MAELTEVVADVAEDVAEQAFDVAVAARGWTPREGGLLMAGAAVGLVGGALVGWGLCEKKLRTKYEQIAEDEIDQMREHFRARLVAREEKPDLAQLTDKAEDLGYGTPNRVEVPRPDKPAVIDRVPEDGQASKKLAEVIAKEHATSKNIFEEAAVVDDWDYEIEQASRSPEKPYVIHVDERHEHGYTESTFTFYEGDNVVCDERDSIVDAVEEILGEDNLSKFGHGSGDRNVVYIRNDALGVEVEVCRSQQSYAEEVHGLKHSDYEPHRRREPFDDER